MKIIMLYSDVTSETSLIGKLCSTPRDITSNKKVSLDQMKIPHMLNKPLVAD